MAQFFRYPTAGAVTLSAIGTNGSTAPTSSIEIGGINPSANLQPLQTDASGNLLIVDASPAVAKHVIVDSSALPAGASTSALQTTGNTSLSSIDGKLGSLGQKAMAGSAPVVIASDQSTLPVSAATLPLPSGAATSAKQDTGNTSLASIDTKLTSPLTVTGPLTDTQLRATPVPVSGTVSVSGVATAANQATEIASLASIDGKTPALGQALAGASVPVVLTASQLSTLTPLSTIAATQSGTWNITNISGTVSLPTGASTSALQTTGNTSLSSIDGKTPALGQALAAASVPIVLTASQLSTLTPLSTVAATQSGTWTVQPGNTANTTAWLVNSVAKTPTAGTVTSAAITVGTTAVRATVSGSAPSATRSVLIITPDSASTATFYIGPSGVTNSGATRGAQIVGGQPFVANSDAGDYYIISSTASQTVYITEQA